MSGSAPLVLSCSVHTVDDLHFCYSAPKPEVPPSRPLSIVSRQVFGVYGADEAVKALHLETRVADAPALSHLTVRGGAASYMIIHAVDANLIVLDWCFPTIESRVYLVYNAVEQSITMIPSDPWYMTPVKPGERCATAADMTALIARLPTSVGGDGRSYALVKIAERSIYSGYNYQPHEQQDVLYVWRSSSRSREWDLIRADFPSLFKGDNVAHSYTTVLAFTCGRHAFWANLFLGIMYCRVDAMLSPPTPTPGGNCKLKLEFMPLPDKDPPCAISRTIEMRSDMYRTIGRSGESSIKFVTIHGFVQLKEFVDCTLKVWSLLPDQNMERWTNRSLRLGILADQEEFKNAELPIDMVPMYPRLSAEEEDVVYFMLGEYTKCCRLHKHSKNRCNGYIPIARNPLYHLRVDMRRGVLLASACLPDSTSPSMNIASTSVVPSSMIQRGSTGRKDGNRKKGGRFASSQGSSIAGS